MLTFDSCMKEKAPQTMWDGQTSVMVYGKYVRGEDGDACSQV